MSAKELKVVLVMPLMALILGYKEEEVKGAGSLGDQVAAADVAGAEEEGWTKELHVVPARVS